MSPSYSFRGDHYPLLAIVRTEAALGFERSKLGARTWADIVRHGALKTALEGTLYPDLLGLLHV
jgi:hypothetical protein